MNFVISDEILENLICESCLRFLSASPVKIYANKYTKCGRCSRNGDLGVVSLFGIVAEMSLFKCINRFDGCRQLLKSSQVLDHEAECETTEYSCPCCLNSVVSTYLMPKHFEQNHPMAVLHRPVFSVDWKGEPQSDFEKIFIYRFKDYLFVVSFKFEAMRKEIYLNVYYLGKERNAARMKHKFVVHCTGENLIIQTQEKACVPYSKYGMSYSDESDNSSMMLMNLFLKQIIFVEMELDVSDATEDFILPHPTNAAPKYVQSRSTNTKILRQEPKSTNTEEPIENTSGKNHSLENFRRLSAICYEKDLIFPRKIYLNTDFKDKFKGFSTDLDFYKLVKGLPRSGDLEIILPCFICSDINTFISSYRKSAFLRNDQSYFWICKVCLLLHKRNEPDKSKFCQALAVLEHDVYTSVQHFCIWGCGTLLYPRELHQHETNCVSQSTRPCPVDKCTHIGKLFEIEKHFAGEHPRTNLSMRSKFSTEVNSNKSIYFDWYVWTPPFFVLVNFFWFRAAWSIRIKTCEAHPGVQPRFVLYDKEGEFLGTVGCTENKQYTGDKKDVILKIVLNAIRS